MTHPSFFGLPFEFVFTPTLSHSTTRLRWPLEDFLWVLKQCSDHVTSSADIRLSNGTKMIALERREKIGHAFLKKRPPHLPFESYFTSYFSKILTFQKFLYISFRNDIIISKENLKEF